MRVELDVFSGRPNPTWELSPPESEEFLTRARRLSPVPAVSPSAPALGYRGLVVCGGGDGDGRGDMRVGHGVVSADRCYADPGRSLEQWLLGTAAGRIDAVLLVSVQDGSLG